MPDLSRRGFIAATVAAGAMRTLPIAMSKPPVRRVVTVVFDKALGAMRLIDRVVP